MSDQPIPATPHHVRTYRVAAVSSNRNSFGLRGHILMAETGETWEVLRSDYTGHRRWRDGEDIAVRLDTYGQPQWHRRAVECPRRLPAPPAEVVRELWKEGK